MKTWNATTIVWTQSCPTNIPISNWWDKYAKVKPCHSLSHIGMTLQSNGTGLGKIALNRGHSGLCIEDHHVVEHRLEFLKAQGVEFHWGMVFDKSSTGFGEFSFKLKKNEHFTDQAINIAKQIAEALGISGENLEYYLSRFHVTQQTRVHVNGKWIGFADYLRIKHNLPNLSGTGWGDSY